MIFTLTRLAINTAIKSLLIVLSSFTTIVTVQAQHQNILSLKFGMVNSSIYILKKDNASTDFAGGTSPMMAITLKHQLHQAFRLGIETGFLSESRGVKWSYTINPDETVETEGKFQRNSLYAMITPEFSLPEIKWLYLNVGAGLIHHFQNQYSNATQRILPFSASAIPIRNLDILVPSGTGFITKIGVGVQFAVNNSVMIGLDASYFSTSLYTEDAGYLGGIQTPYIGFKGGIVAVNLGFIFNK
jgi:hypothetical protein